MTKSETFEPVDWMVDTGTFCPYYLSWNLSVTVLLSSVIYVSSNVGRTGSATTDDVGSINQSLLFRLLHPPPTLETTSQDKGPLEVKIRKVNFIFPKHFIYWYPLNFTYLNTPKRIFTQYVF